MLELNFIKENKEKVLEGLKKRNFPIEDLGVIDQLISLDDKRKAIQTQLDKVNAERKQISDSIGTLFKEGKRDEAEQKKLIVLGLKEKIGEHEVALKSTKNDLSELLYTLPNVPHTSVPKGKGDEDNEMYQEWGGSLPELGASAIPHWELAKKYNLFSLELGTKIAGAGFPVYMGKGAKLQRALISFFLDEAANAGYQEIIPPHLVNEDTARATGQLPDKEGQMYYVSKDDLYLIPTAEVPVTNLYRDVIIKEEDFPIKLTAYSPCFRREAGSYGAHVRGLNRVHQFDKVEIVQIQHPERSYESLDNMVKHVEQVLQKLELPYRILRLCGGDLGFTSALTFDFEVYSAAQKRWLEVSSVSNFETFQSNRLKVRFKDGKQMRLAHTLNGSALALARIVAAILENNQNGEGIKVPNVLRSYTGFDLID